MDFFTWNDRFSTGIEAMDSQHQDFLSLLNELHGAVEGRGRGNLTSLLDSFENYVRVHFTAEENLLRRVCYPDLPAQHRQHNFFAAQVAELKRRNSSGEAGLGASTLVFLRDWLLNHILAEDRKYGDFIAENVKP